MIITTVEQIKGVLTTLAAEVNYSDFEPYLKDSEDWVSDELLGDTIYLAIEDESITDAKLLRLIVNVIVLKSYDLGIPFMDLVQTRSGFGVISDKNRTPASQNRVDRLIAQNKFRLNTNIETLINYLEDNSTYHDNWKSSGSYSLLSDCLINTSRQFKRFAPFDGDRNDFIKLKPKLISDSSIKICPAISKAYLNELIAKQNADTLSDNDKVILPAVKQAIANYAIENDLIAYRLIQDVVTILDNNPDDYTTYHASNEKLLKDTPGLENLSGNPFFISNTSI